MGRAVDGPEYLRVSGHRLSGRTCFADLGVPLAAANGRAEARQYHRPARWRIAGRARRGCCCSKPIKTPCRSTGMTIEPWTPDDSRRPDVWPRLVRHQRGHGRHAGALCAPGSRAARRHADRSCRLHRQRRARLHRAHGALTKLWDAAGLDHSAPPDAAVIAEPTELDVVVAHKGAVRWRLHTLGRAAHSSQPHLGDNAIYRMAPVLRRSSAMPRDVVPGLGQHPLCGRPTLSVGTIHGGLSVNTVPDRCTIEIDRRVCRAKIRRRPTSRWSIIWPTALPQPDRVRARPAVHGSHGLADTHNGRAGRAAVRRSVAAAGRSATRSACLLAPNASATIAAGVPRSCSGPARSPRPTRPTNGSRSISLSRPAKSIYRLRRRYAAISAVRLDATHRQRRAAICRSRARSTGLELVEDEVVARVVELSFGKHVVPGLVVDRTSAFPADSGSTCRPSSCSTGSTRSSADSRRTDSGRSGSSPGCCRCGPTGRRNPAGPGPRTSCTAPQPNQRRMQRQHACADHRRPPLDESKRQRHARPDGLGVDAPRVPMTQQPLGAHWAAHSQRPSADRERPESACLGSTSYPSAAATAGIEGISVKAGGVGAWASACERARLYKLARPRLRRKPPGYCGILPAASSSSHSSISGQSMAQVPKSAMCR